MLWQFTSLFRDTMRRGAYDICKDFCSDYRIIAPSRFGYLGSDVSGDGTPARQAAAYVELLDKLGIDKVYLLATSAGGSVAIRFALDYPQRTKGLILYCSAMPPVEKPEKYAEYAGPPPFLCNDYVMFLLSPMFEPIMGMEPSTIYSMLPIAVQFIVLLVYFLYLFRIIARKREPAMKGR